MELIQNKVADSGLIVLDLADFLPKEPVVGLDIKDFLFHGMVLREKEFREQVRSFDWEGFSGKFVALYCSTDAIVPRWAYMLIAANLFDKAIGVYAGTPQAYRERLALLAIDAYDVGPINEGRIILKGCGDDTLNDAMYTHMSLRLLPVVKSLMYGEPCSTVPVYKKK